MMQADFFGTGMEHDGEEAMAMMVPETDMNDIEFLDSEHVSATDQQAAIDGFGLVTHDGDTMKTGLSVEQHHVPIQHVTLHLVARLQILGSLLSVAILQVLPAGLIALTSNKVGT